MQTSHEAPGKNGIPADLLEQGGEFLTQTQILHQFICKTWNEKQMPCD
jgi:hypothetical protein